MDKTVSEKLSPTCSTLGDYFSKMWGGGRSDLKKNCISFNEENIGYNLVMKECLSLSVVQTAWR